MKEGIENEQENVRCPICGCLNKGLALDETHGWMECIKCKTVVQIQPEKYVKKISVFDMSDTKSIVNALARK